MDSIASFVLAALVLAGSPGPNTLSVAAAGASFGRARGIAYMVGLNLGMVGVIAIVGLGISGAVLAVPGAAGIVAVAAALYFVYLAYRIATAPPLAGATARPRGQAPRWYEGAGLSLVNPKAYAAMAAMFSGHVLIAGDRLADGLAKAALLVGVICLVNLAWLWIGAASTGWLQNPHVSRAVNVTFAVLLLLAVALATLP